MNPWGNGFSGSSPFWIGNSSQRHLHALQHQRHPDSPGRVHTAPACAAASATGAVTGVLFNSASPSFNVASGKPASFIFCTEDGTVSVGIPAWTRPAPSSWSTIRSLARCIRAALWEPAGTSGMLYAANFNAGTIDVWDGSLNPVTNSGAFANPAIPAGFAPFNIQNIGGTLYVTYAKQDSTKHFDVAGVGNGYVATFDTTGKLLANLVSAGVLNSPWGLAMAPATFGVFSGALPVSNFGDGLIHAYNATTGGLMGTLTDPGGQRLSRFQACGPSTLATAAVAETTRGLYFTAGMGGPNGAPINIPRPARQHPTLRLRSPPQAF